MSNKRMSDARTVIANTAYKFLLDDTKPTGDVSDAILAALADAGLEIRKVRKHSYAQDLSGSHKCPTCGGYCTRRVRSGH